ncbi:hypothetical protein FQA39_LY10376 [Lamprigera yunnana]|nr:hypothetical protein FQA39_LY10376 [Lamprigera yunnana]
MQEKIDEKCEKNYEEFDYKMVERKKQVDNNSGHIDGKCKGLRELIDVETKINQDTEEKIQIYKDLKEQRNDIVIYIEEKTKIWNSTGNKMIMNYKQLEEELLNKVRIIEVKKFDEVVRKLEIHYECGRDRVRNDGNEYYNHYNNYEQKKYNYSGQGRNNHNYSQGPYQGNQFYYYHKNVEET